jgi:cytochrome c-type biogenesis protein CcmH
MAKLLRFVGFVLAALMLTGSLQGKEAQPASADPELEKRVVKIAAELRCLVCQNQTIADSSAGLAVDLRNQVREMLRQGQSEQAIIDYMTARYGDFVLYRPPVKGSTMVLWYGPMLLLLGGALALFLVLRKRSRMAPEAFEPDDPDDQSQAQTQALTKVGQRSATLR